MTTVAATSGLVTLAIDLGQGDTSLPDCHDLPEREYLGTYYANPQGPLSVVQLPETGDEYEYRTCSKVVRENARYSARLGYRHELIDRADWEDDLFAIRSSAEERQGRRMPDAYLERQSYSSDAWPDERCMRHLTVVHGVIGDDGHLAAYCQLVQCGDVVRVNTILGHADKLRDRVVWLLVLEAFKWHIHECRARYGLYFTHGSGHGYGLRYWKERFGFLPSTVEWVFA